MQVAGCSMEGGLRVQVAELFNGGRFEDASGWLLNGERRCKIHNV